MYGFYGMGEKSTKLSFGWSLGMIFKMGRIQELRMSPHHDLIHRTARMLLRLRPFTVR